MDEKEVLERLEAAAVMLEQAIRRLDERENSNRFEHISATVEPSQREEELQSRLHVAEQQLAELRASTASGVLTPLRRTVPSSTSEMLAKHGIGEGPVDVRTLDAALSGLSLEQRIAVKTQLLRAGAIA
jgi:hypothetical protein